MIGTCDVSINPYKHQKDLHSAQSKDVQVTSSRADVAKNPWLASAIPHNISLAETQV